MAFLPILMGIGAAYSALKGSQNQGRSNELNEQALELARADYEDRKPLRQAFTQGALSPIAQAPDLSSLFSAVRSDNPFATGGPPRSAHVPSQLNFTPPALPPSATPTRPGPSTSTDPRYNDTVETTLDDVRNRTDRLPGESTMEYQIRKRRERFVGPSAPPPVPPPALPVMVRPPAQLPPTMRDRRSRLARGGRTD